MPDPTPLVVAIAEVLDRAFIDAAGPVLLHAVLEADDVVLGVRELAVGVHPCDALGGWAGSPRWWAVGLRVHGTAHRLDAPDAGPSRIVSTFVLARDGSHASLLREGARVSALPGPVHGRIPDLCRALLVPSAKPGREVAP
ncbi:MAG: hypothetical protein Q8K58_07470 [Acidimicrobiales bacterium]|nr:hypothetical protein [Acidimicrobiales bacterium]